MIELDGNIDTSVAAAQICSKALSEFNNTGLVSSVPRCVISQIGGWDGLKVTIHATAHFIHCTGAGELQKIFGFVSRQALITMSLLLH